jgi:hypothetical protein
MRVDNLAHATCLNCIDALRPVRDSIYAFALQNMD